MIQRLPVGPSRGTARIVAAAADGRTYLARLQAREPVKLLAPQASGRAAWIFHSSFGGGLVAGDVLQLDIDIQAEARLFVGSQASTKVYTCAGTRASSRQDLQARAAADSLLVYCPDPVTCFAGARYQQRQCFLLESGSSLCAVDWLTAGRSARGERWAFASLASHSSLAWDGGPVVAEERLYLAEDSVAPPLARRLAGIEILATIWLVGPACASAGGWLQQRLAAASPAPELLQRLTPIEAGWQWRLAGADIQEVVAEVHSLLDHFTESLGGAPWRRRP